MDRPKIYYMRKDDLAEFVRTKARPGNIAYTRDTYTGDQYIYHCTHDNIGEGAEPCWYAVDTRYFLKQKLKSMSLEEKVDFLIERYITDHGGW